MQAAGGASLTGPDRDLPAAPEVAELGVVPQAGPSAAAAAAPRRVAVLGAVALAVVVADIATKVAVVATFAHREPVRLLGGALVLREVRNPGAAFGIAGGATVLFTLVAVVVVVAIARTARRLRSLPWAIALGLLLGGALGNLADRLLRSPGPLRGQVVDWIDFRIWPVFNLADSAIVVGGLLAVVIATRGIEVDGRRTVDG